MNIDVNTTQLDLMKHAIGWDNIKPTHKILNSYRNRYYTNPNSVSYKDWIDLVDKNYAISKVINEDQDTLFRVNKKGINLLSSIYKVKIIQDREDIVEDNNETK